jgi:hypothetical protein
MAAVLSDCMYSMKDAPYDCFLIFLFHISFETQFFNLGFVLILTVA